MKRVLRRYSACLVLATICIVAGDLRPGSDFRGALYVLGQAVAMVGALAMALDCARPFRARSLPLVGIATAALALAGYVVVDRPRDNLDLPFLLSLDSLRLALGALVGLVAIAGARRGRWSFVEIAAGLTLFSLLAMALSDAAGGSHYLTGTLIIEGTPFQHGFGPNVYCAGDVPVMATVTAAALACGAMVGVAVRRRDVRFAGGALTTACMLTASLLSWARSPSWADPVTDLRERLGSLRILGDEELAG